MSRIAITGATSGIGKALAIELAQKGCELVLLSRNANKGAKVARLCESLNPETRATFFTVDFASQDSVGKAIQTIRDRFDRIDILVSNAGARFDEYQESPDGIELTFATNHLGPLQLTLGLIDLLRKPSPGVVINISSITRKQAVDEPNWFLHRDPYNSRQAYAKSKLANALFAAELSRNYSTSELIALSIDPGIVATGFALNNGVLAWLKHIIYHLKKGDLTRPRSAASAILKLLSHDRLAEFNGGVVYQSSLVESREDLDPELSGSLWKSSIEILEKNRSTVQTKRD